MISRDAKGLSVLQVIPALDAGGAERTAVDVAKAVIDAGGRSWIATSGGRLSREAEAAGAIIVPGPFASKNPLTLLQNARRLTDTIRVHGVQIIHSRSRAPAWSGWLAAKQTGILSVTTYHGIYNARSALKKWYNGIMVRSDAVIANSNFTAAHIQSQYWMNPQNLHVIPRGIDTRAFDPGRVSQERIAALRSQWRVTQGKPLILLPGRLTRWKGQLLFIEALSRLRDLGFQAVLAGDAQARDSYVEELHAAIRRHDLTEVVHIPGHCTDMPAALMLADIVVAPSLEPEAFGRVAVEAQAMGRPIIASSLGGQAETIQNGVTGFLVPPGDAAALAAMIRTALAATHEHLDAMKSSARSRVEGLYSVDAMCAATLSVYRGLLASREADRALPGQ